MDIERQGHAQRRRHHGRPSLYHGDRYMGGWPVYGYGFYLDPSQTGYTTAQHPVEQCPDPASCPDHSAMVDTATMVAGTSGVSATGDAMGVGGATGSGGT